MKNHLCDEIGVPGVAQRLDSSERLGRVGISASDAGDWIVPADFQILVEDVSDDGSNEETEKLHPAENRNVKCHFVFSVDDWSFVRKVRRRSDNF